MSHSEQFDQLEKKPDAPVVPPSVGQQLRAAREAAGLSVSDVAQSLKFSARQVELLEADNYSALPGSTAVRGFTRSYARLLGLDAESLLRLLDSRTPVQIADVRPPDNMGEACDLRNERRLGSLASITIVIMLAAAFLAAWHFFWPEAKPPGAETPPPQQPAPLVEVQPAPGLGDTTATLPPAPADTPGPVPQEIPLPVVAPPPVLPPDPPSALAPIAPAESPPAQAPALSFVFLDRSWVEVTDANKQVLHRGENPGGTQLTLAGRPPFDIVIGNATQVRLGYAGRDIDLAPHTRADVARFRLE